MATTTSKSKSAKPKTTKKVTPARSTRAAAKTTRKTVVTKKPIEKAKASTTKEVKVAAPVKTRQSRVLSFAKVRNLHLLSTGAFLLLAIAAGSMMGTASVPVTFGHLAQDALNGQMVPAAEPLFDLQLRWAAIGIMLVSAFISLLRFRMLDREQAAVERRVVPMRWVDFALTGALMLEITALLSGMHDVVGLKSLAALAVASAAFAWIAERENVRAPRAVRGSFEASAFMAVLALLSLAAMAIATPVYGMIRAPWYVYALYVTLLAGALLVGRVQYRSLRHVNNQASNYLMVERNYIVINVLVKAAFAVILITGLAA